MHIFKIILIGMEQTQNRNVYTFNQDNSLFRYMLNNKEPFLFFASIPPYTKLVPFRFASISQHTKLVPFGFASMQ